MGVFLEVRNLSYRAAGVLGGALILDNLNFTLEAGQTTVLAGPNGSGKSVLARHLGGLLRPQEGRILIEGTDSAACPGGLGRRVGLVLQDPDACLVGLTVWEDLLFGLRNMGLSRQEREDRGRRFIRFLGLEGKEELPPRLLSGGEKKKLTLGGLLIRAPELLILDEPFSGLDYPGVRAVLELLVKLKEEGKGLLVICHDPEKIIAQADRLLLLNRGRLAGWGDPMDLMDQLEPNGIRSPLNRSLSWLS
jgi:biotin transport system ATP-binding protein